MSNAVPEITWVMGQEDYTDTNNLKQRVTANPQSDQKIGCSQFLELGRHLRKSLRDAIGSVVGRG